MGHKPSPQLVSQTAERASGGTGGRVVGRPLAEEKGREDERQASVHYKSKTVRRGVKARDLVNWSSEFESSHPTLLLFSRGNREGLRTNSRSPFGTDGPKKRQADEPAKEGRKEETKERTTEPADQHCEITLVTMIKSAQIEQTSTEIRLIIYRLRRRTKGRGDARRLCS